MINYIIFRSVTIIIACLVLSLLVSGCAVVNSREDHWFGRDKFYHFSIAAAIGAGVSSAVNKNGTSNCKAPVMGVSAAIGLGMAKELYDRNIKKTYWSWKDMFWNLFGGTAGSLAVSRCE
ncbi:MAG: hypothetical protein V3R54_00325 [Thermodesulfovibrionia bacterium]